MKMLHPSLLSHLQGEVTTLAWCWLIARTDGEVLGFTNFDRDLTFDGVTYHSSTGFTPSATTSTNTMAVDNLELNSVFSDHITDKDIIGGKFDSAEVQVFQVNYLDLPDSLESSPPRYLSSVSGLLGEIKISDVTVAAEVRSLSQYLAQKQIQLTSKDCRYEYGDSRCGKTPQNQTFTVTGFETNRKIYLDGDTTFGTAGKITFTSGANSGLSKKIASADGGGTTILYEPMPFVIEIGDEVEIEEGCVKSRDACMAKNNVVNFGGEPDVPGVDEYLKGAG